EKQCFAKNTIIKHIEELLNEKKDIDIEYLLPSEKDCQKIKLAFDKCGWKLLRPVFEKLKEKYDYNTLRLVRAYYLNS
ncbi:MAG: helix-turn-helix domain-containing protein, partial [Patescibacteria group bacterium]